MTEWREFRSPDFDALRECMATPIVFDGRNLYDPELLTQLRFEYQGIGRGFPLMTMAQPDTDLPKAA